nr:NAD(P)/FAD-dependent oxidoreductase [Croceivirga thetidis]
MDYEVIIIGAGLAGLTAAIHLSQNSVSVLVLEKSPLPRHKVCGEYISNEVRPYFKSLGIDFGKEYPSISKFRLQTTSGRSTSCELPLGGFGISRYAIDNGLYVKSLENGVKFRFENVEDVVFNNNSFLVETKSGRFHSKYVLGCFGKRSTMDKKFNRPFIQRKSPWLGIKGHYYSKEFPHDLVALGTFKGGYGGLSMVEDNKVNFCYLVSYESFKEIGDIMGFNEKIVSKNPMLRAFLEHSELTEDFIKPISISQISFEKKRAVENHMLMCGDSAGLIHPLCGNGMAMAITSAKLASEILIAGLKGSIDRDNLEKTYSIKWKNEFSKRLAFGRNFQNLFLKPFLLESGLGILRTNQKLLPYLISKTHGKPMVV